MWTALGLKDLIMKKHYFNFKSLICLVVTLCVAALAGAQDMRSMATCGDNDDAVRFNSPTLRMQLLPGDVNADSYVNITDAIFLINGILANNSLPYGDVNQDGSINVTDAIFLINKILSSDNNPDADIMASLNSVYQSMRNYYWTTQGNWHQSFGISSYNLMAEVMGDDMIMGAMGYGWFYYDAGYNVKSRFTTNSWRSYDLWKAYYTWIANANYLLKGASSMTGSTSQVNYVKGQAYAIRAYSYFMLAQTFARTYKGHETDPCVPLYDGLTFDESTGKQRSTVAQVYAQIDADITQALNCLGGTTQQSPVHIGYAVALGLQARIALVKEDWATAYNSAVAAISASGKSIQSVPDFKGVNDAYAGNVMWGADIPSEENTQNASFWSHMRTDMGYGKNSPKMISLWLYNKMSNTDARKAWWRPNDTGYGPADGYVQQKFSVVDGTEWDGDYIWMRIEEMYLTAAEAACRRGQTATARSYLNQFMAKRDPGYSCTKSGTSLGALTTTETGSLLEEILIQRRIELWGEDGRIYTIRRLRQGFERTADNGWPADIQLASRSLNDPESYPWVLTIPYTEFKELDSRGAMNINQDQNPIDDYPVDKASGPQNVSFLQASQSAQTVSSAKTVVVPIKRATSQGDYYAVINVKPSSSTSGQVSVPSRIIHFTDGQTEASFNVTFSDVPMNQSSSVDIVLSDADVQNASPALGTTITSTRVTVQRRNGNPDGQNIHFESSQITNEYADGVSAKSIPVVICRDVTDGEYSVNVAMTESDGHSTLYTSNFTFSNESASTTLWIEFSGLSDMQEHYCVLKLLPADGSTSDPAISENNTLRITVKPSNFSNLGYCYYESDLLGSSTMMVQYNETSGTYRLLNFFGDSYNIDFTIDDSGKVFIADQTAMQTDYGLARIIGNADGNKTGYAGTYDSQTKKATLLNYYYIPGVGNFGTASDVLTMP